MKKQKKYNIKIHKTKHNSTNKNHNKTHTLVCVII